MELAYTQGVNNFDSNMSYQSSRNILANQHIKEESLPFTVKIVHTDEEMEKAVGIRHSAYSRHVPEMAALLVKPEAFDFDDGSIVLLAESKLDGSALGSMRVQTNRYEKLKLESSVTLPTWLQGQILAEAARLGVVGNRMGRIVKTLLFKAYYLYCISEAIDWMVITARAPVDKDYESLFFKDVFPGAGYIPMYHDANIAHRVMALDVTSVEPNWKAANHVLYDLFFRTHHPDIDTQLRSKPTLNIIPANVPTSNFGATL